MATRSNHSRGNQILGKTYGTGISFGHDNSQNILCINRNIRVDLLRLIRFAIVNNKLVVNIDETHSMQVEFLPSVLWVTWIPSVPLILLVLVKLGQIAIQLEIQQMID